MLLQLLSASLSPCCRYHPAGVECRISQSASLDVAFTLRLWARPPGLSFSGPPMRSLALRPGDSRSSSDDPVDGLQVIGFPPPCHPSYKASGFYLGGTVSR